MKVAVGRLNQQNDGVIDSIKDTFELRSRLEEKYRQNKAKKTELSECVMSFYVNRAKMQDKINEKIYSSHQIYNVLNSSIEAVISKLETFRTNGANQDDEQLVKEAEEENDDLHVKLDVIESKLNSLKRTR